MDVSKIGQLATSIAETGTRQEVGIAVFKKAQEVQAATATQLIDALKATPTVQNLPPHLGTKINTTA